MRRHLINKSIDLVSSAKGWTKLHHSDLDSEAAHIMECEVNIDCDSPMKLSGSHMDQKIAAEWRARREESIGLAIRMKLFKEASFPVSAHRKNFYQSGYELTKFGIFYKKSPKFLQTIIVGLYLWVGRISKFATRFKWVTGVVSFAALALKVWHSGLISNWWIGLSALIGLVVGLLATLLK